MTQTTEWFTERINTRGKEKEGSRLSVRWSLSTIPRHSHDAHLFSAIPHSPPTLSGLPLHFPRLSSTILYSSPACLLFLHPPLLSPVWISYPLSTQPAPLPAYLLPPFNPSLPFTSPLLPLHFKLPLLPPPPLLACSVCWTLRVPAASWDASKRQCS